MPPTPLLTQLLTSARSRNAPFHTPGHHKGQGSPEVLKEWWGEAIFQADLPELPELDNLFAPEGVIQEAEALAAQAWGSDRTFFLTNGSTAGLLTAILATCKPGDSVLLPRNVHRSVISGLILAGANPVFLTPEYDAVWDIAHTIRLQDIEQQLENDSSIKAVVIVSPTYYGVCSDIASIAKMTHDRNLPLIVDEAHGAHLHFHPSLPIDALSAGADLVVQSTHKTLSALTQAAMLHCQGDRVSHRRIANALALVQSSSPNYLLLASLDAARMQMQTQGQQLLSPIVEQAQQLRSQINAIPGLRTLEKPPLSANSYSANSYSANSYSANSYSANSRSAIHQLDPLRLTVLLDSIDGFSADEQLHETLGVTCELPALRSLTFILTHGTTQSDCDRLLQALRQLQPISATNGTNPTPDPIQLPPLPKLLTSPRNAFFCDTKTLTIPLAIGQACAELICPYPPGIPILMPGEEITIDAIDYLKKIAATGGVLTGCSDPHLQTIQVIA